MKKNMTQKITFVGLMTAVTVILSQLAIPMPSGIPVTLQTFAIALVGYMLGYKYGVAAIFTYILLGAVGIPVFSNFRGGISVLVSVTGGFIWGFLPMAFCCGLSSKMKVVFSLLLGAAGLIICHTAGTAQYALVSGIPFTVSFLQVSLPYLLKDILSVIAACFLSRAVRKKLKLDF